MSQTICFLNLASYYNETAGQPDSSLFYFFKSLDIAQENQDKKMIPIILSHISQVYFSLKQFDKATLYIEKSLSQLSGDNRRKDILYTLSKAIDMYDYLQDTAKVRILQNEFDLIKSQKPPDKKQFHENMGFFVENEKVDQFIEDVLPILKDKKLAQYLDEVLNMASKLEDKKKYKEALKLLHSGRSHLTDSMFALKRQFYRKFVQLYTFDGRADKVLAYTDSLILTEKEMFNIDRIWAIKELEARYEKLEQEKFMEILKKEKVWAQRNFYLALISLAFLVMLVISILYTLSQKNKNLKLLEFKNSHISDLLSEKELLLKEIHHRVKNNLQIVSSLLNLQSSYITDSTALEAINEGKNRVLSMSLIHQNLYSEDNLSKIETRKYFEDLLSQLFESYKADKNKIKLTTQIDSSYEDVEIMIPLGLMVNELVSNVLKHAFEGRNEGTLHFTFKSDEQRLELSLKDNGVGIDEHTFKSSRSFGNKLIHSFVRKLKASLRIFNDQGTLVSISVHRVSINASVA
jgi:two-component sensor histidine kinase